MSEEEGRERAVTVEGDAESMNDGRALVQPPARSGDVIT